MNRAIVLGMLMAVAAAPAAAQQCTLEYQRADNMWSATGRPDGPLGKETLTLEPGQTKVFNTDWKYEKRRNDGENYYGSHARIVRNAGKRPIKVVFRGDDIGSMVGAARDVLSRAGDNKAVGGLEPGISWNVRADLMEASCPVADKEAKVPPPSGLLAKQISPREIELTWQKVSEAKEYRIYVDPPPQPHLAGRPGVIGGNGSRWLITLPPSVAPSTVYRASIETVGPTGATSVRMQFNRVTVQLASGPGGTPQGGGGAGSPPTGTPSSSSGQHCPPGQFVAGLDSAGKIVCAKP